MNIILRLKISFCVEKGKTLIYLVKYLGLSLGLWKGGILLVDKRLS
jgi:hypothetical protein